MIVQSRSFIIGLALGATVLLASGVETLAAQALVPRPAQQAISHGSFRFPDNIDIALPLATPRLREIATVLSGALSEAGISSRVIVADSAPGGIVLQSGGPLHDESYRLTVSGEGISIVAQGDAGALWGVQTLRQLVLGAESRTLAAMQIVDAPRFEWRGSMIDVSRHFFPVDYLIYHLEWMSRHKLNVMHWHLTDDQGWRLQVDAHPRLTTVGAWRNEDRAGGARYGGYYTKADVRRVVEHARKLGITVVPEIEIPGHSRAALAAYPHLGCTGDTLPVPTTWGVFADVLCPTGRTFEFIEAVLTEVLELFPSRFIHLGGDEVPTTRWQECEECQAIIAREGLGGERELQGWMMKRVAQWLAERGRTMIGWDEILDGGAPRGAVVQAWQGSDRIRAAIAAGADVIASPQDFVYLNRQPGDLTLAQVVSFDPVSSVGSGDGRLLGAEAPLWAEHVTSARNAELMWWPRLLGFAEAVWSGPADTDEFAERASVIAAQMQRAGVAVGPGDRPLYSIGFGFDSVQRRIRVGFQSAIDNLQLKLIGDGATATIGDGSLLPQGGNWLLSAMIGDDSVGEPRSIVLENHLAVGRPISFATAADSRYPGTGSSNLVDGARGATFRDGFWNGWWGSDLDATVDLESTQSIGTVKLSLLEEVNSWIVYPRSVEIHLADQAGNWRLVASQELAGEIAADAASTRVVELRLPEGTRARKVRVVARTGGPLPAWHPGAGSPAWIFADEILVGP
jgi:hexosaminidase